MPRGPACPYPVESNLRPEGAPELVPIDMGEQAGPESSHFAAMAPQIADGQWFALVVKPRFDKAVGRTLEAKGYQTLVPTYRKYHTYGARSKITELPLFPGYVCCRFDMNSSLPILSTPGVIRVIGTRSVPTPLSEIEINALQAAMRAHLPVQPFPFVSAGQRVRITSGILAGIEGIVLGPKPKLRLVLSITLLQRSVLLEIDQDQVSPQETFCLAPCL